MPTTPEDIAYTVTTKDGWAFWYAWGRMDQGHPPVPATSGTTETAWKFGRLYAEQERAFLTGEQSYAHGVQTAWENYVASEGKSIETPEP